MSCADELPPVDMNVVSATSILSGEHRVILQVLDVLEQVVLVTLRDRRIPTEHASKILEVLRQFADQCHHAKEENVLFPMLEAISPGFGPIRVMMGEHVEGRAAIHAMAVAVATRDAPGFATAAGSYVDLLRNHISKEDNILFRFADQMLSPDQHEAILESYRRLEHDDIGDGTHERLLGIADTLAGVYGIPRASDDPQTMHLLTAICGCAAKKGHHA